MLYVATELCMESCTLYIHAVMSISCWQYYFITKIACIYCTKIGMHFSKACGRSSACSHLCQMPLGTVEYMFCCPRGRLFLGFGCGGTSPFGRGTFIYCRWEWNINQLNSKYNNTCITFMYIAWDHCYMILSLPCVMVAVWSQHI